VTASDLVSFVQANWLWVVSILIALTSLALTIIPLVRSLPRARLCYAVWGVTKLPGFARVGTRREPTPVKGRRRRVTVSWLTLWNGGIEEIRSTHNSTTDQLRVALKAKSLTSKPRIVAMTNPANEWELRPQSDAVFVSFSFLNPRDGAVIRLQHTGRDPRQVELKGTLVKAGTPFRMADPSGLAGRVSSAAWLVYILVAFAIFPIATFLFLGPSYPWFSWVFVALILGDLGPAYAAYHYRDVRMVAPKALRDAAVGLPELKGFEGRIPFEGPR